MVHSFLLIGQSNMAGRGFLNEARPFAGIGLGASFAKRWLEDHPDEEIGLIPCADGGSCRDEWMPGTALFDHMVYQVELPRRISVLDGLL